MSVRLSRPTFVGSTRERVSACGRWRVVTHSTHDRHSYTHDLYDRGACVARGLATLAGVRAEIERREIVGSLAIFRGQDRYFVDADAPEWIELERRGLVTISEDDDGDTYAEMTPLGARLLAARKGSA